MREPPRVPILRLFRRELIVVGTGAATALLFAIVGNRLTYAAPVLFFIVCLVAALLVGKHQERDRSGGFNVLVLAGCGALLALALQVAIVTIRHRHTMNRGREFAERPDAGLGSRKFDLFLLSVEASGDPSTQSSSWRIPDPYSDGYYSIQTGASDWEYASSS
ncbi:MAG: hypothetical protein IPH13_03570 [Planctomycetes bacterium]|nr:hypothetical protein [Planctomycetota bacterium]